MSILEIMRGNGWSKATVHCRYSTLENEGFISSKTCGKGLVIAQPTPELALGVVESGSFGAYCHGILMEVSREINETCSLTVPLETPGAIALHG